MKYFVTSATGFIGGHVARQLRASGHEVITLVRTPSKVQAVESLMQAGLPLVIVLPGLVYGPDDTSIIHQGWVNYLSRKLPILPSGTTYCWTHVDDAAHGHLLAMERGKAGESYIIAGPKYSVIEAFTLAEQISSVRAPRLHLAPWMMKAMAAMVGLIDTAFPLPEPL